MDESKIGVRYAKAMFQNAEEKKILQVVRNDMELLYGVCDTLHDFRVLLESPIVSTSQKRKIFGEVFRGRIHPASTSFLELLLKNKREIHLKAVARNFIEMFRKHSGITKAVFTSVEAIDKDLQQKIKDAIRKNLKSEIELTQVVDPKLIGGFTLRIDDKQLDASMSTQLKKIERELVNKAFEKKI